LPNISTRERRTREIQPTCAREIKITIYIYIYIYIILLLLQIDLAEYLEKGGAGGGGGEGGGDGLVYCLHSVLVHCGDVHGGHYFVYIRPDCSTSWLKFNDEKARGVAFPSSAAAHSTTLCF
jgi:hypothetical protein